MRVLRLIVTLGMVQAGWPVPAPAQEWNTPGVAALVARAIARRSLAEDSGGPLRWEAKARGMVLFLTQIGDELSTPRLVKADELAVEVYWEAPGRSKQTITAWRDHAWLPTDIQYHRDHLGIVANDFGPMIRIGDGDEVRDVPHPLSPLGATTYEFALQDSVSLSSGGQRWQVYAVRVRPRDATTSAVIGTLYLDQDSGALVRFQFSFTPASYREPTLEDIAVVLENALHNGGFWLPWRQEIEIRRRAGMVDLPIRGIIRGRWQLDDYRFEDEVAPQPFVMGNIGGLREPGGPPGHWDGLLEDRVTEWIGPVDRLDFTELRHEVRQGLSGIRPRVGPPVRPALGSFTDLARFNRVEGLRLGAGASLRPGGIPLVVAPWMGYGFANRRLSGRVEVALEVGARSRIRLFAGREVRDIGQSPIISPALNSVLAQEFGVDRADWAERRTVGVGWSSRSEGNVALGATIALEAWESPQAVAMPARGQFRPNPALGSASFATLRLEASRGGTAGPVPGAHWRLELEGGGGDDTYLRLVAAAAWQVETGSGALRLAADGGWGSHSLPPMRGFVLGGWGTLVATPFRAYGGRRFLSGRVEWLTSIRLPGVAVGSFPAIDPGLQVGPFFAAGATGGLLPTGVGQTSGGIRPVAGIAIEGLFGLLWLELGYALRGGAFGFSGDIVSSWWGIL